MGNRWFGIGIAIALNSTIAYADVSLVEAAARNDAAAVEAIAITPQNRDAVDVVRGWPAMAYACRAGNSPLVARLLQSGADPNQPTKDLYLPLSLAAASGDVATMRVLVDAGAEVDAVTSANGPAILVAARAGNLPALAYLIECGAKVEQPSHNGQTALTHAVFYRHYDAARLLVRHDAREMQILDGEMRSDAYTITRIQLVYQRLLAEQGESVGMLPAPKQAVEFVEPTEREVALDLLRHEMSWQRDQQAFGVSLLRDAAAAGDEALIDALIENGATFVPEDSGFKEACENGHAACALKLLNMGAVVNEYTFDNLWKQSTNRNDVAMIRLLMQAQAKWQNETDAPAVVAADQLIDAAWRDDLAAIERILAEPIALPMDRLAIALNVARSHGNIQTTRYLDRLMEKHQRTAHRQNELDDVLMKAVRAGDIVGVRAALVSGADVDGTDYYRAVDIAANRGNIEMVDVLIRRGAQINEARDAVWGTVLTSALAGGHLDVVQYLLDKGADPRLTGQGTTPLAAAAGNGHTAVVTLLLGRGVDVNQVAWRNESALIAAARNNSPAAAEMLLAAGADPDFKDADGYTALDYAANHARAELVIVLQKYQAQRSGRSMASPLIQVIDNPAEFARLLEAGADPNQSGGWFPGTVFDHIVNLNHYTNERYQAIRLFFRYGGVVRKDSPAIMSFARNANGLEGLRILVEQGVDINSPREYDGRTALMCAVAATQTASVQFLLESGADVDPKDRKGLTALDLARHSNDGAIIQLIENASSRNSGEGK